jgi:hypothetical protein
MFHSTGNYKGLDAFFYTKYKGTLRSKIEIKKRIKELDEIFDKLPKPWTHSRWYFSKKAEKNEEINKFVNDSLERLRDANLNYTLGIYDASLFLSSLSVEILSRALLTLRIRNAIIHSLNAADMKTEWVRIVKPQNRSWYIIKNNKNGEWFKKYVFIPWFKAYSPVVRYKKKLYYISYPLLTKSMGLISNEKTLHKLADKVLDNSETLSDCIFITRRDISAHGFYERSYIAEQVHNIRSGTSLNFLYNNENALDQYKKATNFIYATYAWFDKHYTHYL